MKRIAWGVGFVVLMAAGLCLGLWLGRYRTPDVPGEPTVGGSTEEAWLERLRSADVDEGTKAWQGLADLGEQGLPILLKARKDSDVRAHRRAALGLVKVGAPAVPGLIEALPRGGDRVEVILARIGKPAVPELSKSLRDRERARQAARVLGAIGEPAREAMPALAALLADSDAAEDARAEAAWAIGAIGPAPSETPVIGDPVVLTLTAALAPSAPAKVKREAAWALGRCGQAARPAVPALSRLVKEKDADTSRAACHALGRIGAAESAEVLLWRLRQPDGEAAAAALGRLGLAAVPAISGLVEALASDKPDARLARAVLERLGPIAVPDLEAALKAKGDVTRLSAASVLGLMGPRAATAAKALAAMLKDDDPYVAIAAASALVRIEPEQTEPILKALTPLLTHKDEAVAAAATAVVSELGPDAKEVVAVLRKLLASTDEKVAGRAAQALGRTGSKDDALALLPLLKAPQLRPEASVAIMRLDPGQGKRVADALAADLAAEDVARQKRALQALAAMPTPPDAIVEPLLPLLSVDGLGPWAGDVLARCRPEALGPAIAALVSLLSSRDEARRSIAEIVFMRAGGEPACEPLRAALAARSPETRAAAVNALAFVQARRGDRSSVPAVLPLLADEEATVRLAALRALRRMRAAGEEVNRAALPLLAHDKAEVRAQAAWLLAEGAAPPLPALTECLLDPDEEVRDAARRMPPVKDPDALLIALLAAPPAADERTVLRQLEADLRGEDLRVRLEAARRLFLKRPERREAVLALLLSVLEGWDAQARLEAARTLGELGKEAGPALAALRRRVRRDESARVRQACEASIQAMER